MQELSSLLVVCVLVGGSATAGAAWTMVGNGVGGGGALTQLYWVPSSQMYVWGRAGPYPMLQASGPTAPPRPPHPPPPPAPPSTAAAAANNAVQCGRRLVGDRRRPKIVGGTETAYGAYPWQVEIATFNVDTGNWKHHCGGSIVAADIVVTAAHCLQAPVQKEKLRIIAGDHHLQRVDAHEQIMAVADIMVHPDFRKNGHYSNDIAVIKVRSRTGRAGGFSFNMYVQPVCLPAHNSGPPPGTWCDVSGWGAQNGEDMESLAERLHAVTVPVIGSALCRGDDLYGGRQQSILDSMVCAGHLEGGRDACGGDSGGPLACHWRGAFHLAGVVSWGDGCAKRNRPGVYTRVDHFIPWLRHAAAALHSRIPDADSYS